MRQPETVFAKTYAFRMYRAVVVCPGCGIEFEAHHPTRLYCCTRCKFLYIAARSLWQCDVCEAKLEYGVHSTVPQFVDEHLECRIRYLNENGRANDCRCPECKRVKGITGTLPVADSVKQRRPRAHGKHRQTVLERDNYICRLCWEPTDPNARPGEADYPTLDHIIPVIDGGDDSLENLQTAHRWCNSVSGAKWY